MTDKRKRQVAWSIKDDQDVESLSGSRDEQIRQSDGYVIADNQKHQVALSIEYDQDTEPVDVTRGKSIQQIQQSESHLQEEGLELQPVEVDGKEDNDSDEECPYEKIQDPADRERSLLETIETKKFHKVQANLTAKALMSLGNNPLLSAIKVTEKLHDRADKKGPDKADFIDLATRVEEFTLRFLDPLKYDDVIRDVFSSNPETNIILETGIKLEQKKFFDHPIIIDLMAERWYGSRRALISSRPWWLFLNIWCLFDFVLFPLSFFVTFVLARIAACTGTFQDLEQLDSDDEHLDSPSIFDRYKEYFTAPYFIFVRDTMSYLALLGLHLAICLEPSQLSFSALEWAILVFLLGRLLMELNQITKIADSEREKERKRSEEQRGLRGYLRSLRSTGTKDQKMSLKALKNYLRDRWNILDLTILFSFFCFILPMRIYTWKVSESATNNRVLLIAGFLYGFNTMFLTIRAFGHMLETIKGVGTIQIALFHIIRDVFVVVVHFVAITLAFSSTMAKVYVTETSVVEEDPRAGKTLICNETGILCWWRITTHLGWSLLELSEGLELFNSVDPISEHLARLLFAAYLVVALILLINMLIALLSNTYQKVQDNSEKEWAFQKAITIQTYYDYDPVPVPFNIISTLVTRIICFRKKERFHWAIMEELQRLWLDRIVSYLLDKYRLRYGDSFPPTYKLDQVLEDTEKTESMVNQVLYRAFKNQQSCGQEVMSTGPKAWETHRAIDVQGCLLICHDYKCYQTDDLSEKKKRKNARCGARYRSPFSESFPHFEVMILETGETKWLGLGVVFEDYGTTLFPGWEKGTVGYHTDDRNIFDADYADQRIYKKTTGSAAARRGDVIRCTVMFGQEQLREGRFRVPVVFTVNGSRIIIEGDEQARQETQTYIDYSPDKPLYPYVAFKYENSVLAKVCAREDVDQQSLEMQEMKSDLAVLKNATKGLEAKLDAVLAKLGNYEKK